VVTPAQTENLPGENAPGSVSAPPPIGPWAAEKVAVNVPIAKAPNGVRYALWAETRVPQPDVERLSYTVDLGDRAICHRNVTLGPTEAVFLSTRLVEDRFGLAFEFFINVAHNFVDAAGVPESFASLTWSQAQAGVKGETSQDAWETRRRALDPVTNAAGATMPLDERARKNYEESAFSDSLAIYMLSLSLDFDYHDLREREYPLLAAPALAERLRHVAALFPANESYEFQILYRRKG
jgi:hypothetical protein